MNFVIKNQILNLSEEREPIRDESNSFWLQNNFEIVEENITEDFAIVITHEEFEVSNSSLSLSRNNHLGSTNVLNSSLSVNTGSTQNKWLVREQKKNIYFSRIVLFFKTSKNRFVYMAIFLVTQSKKKFYELKNDLKKNILCFLQNAKQLKNLQKSFPLNNNIHFVQSFVSAFLIPFFRNLLIVGTCSGMVFFIASGSAFAESKKPNTIYLPTNVGTVQLMNAEREVNRYGIFPPNELLQEKTIPWLKQRVKKGLPIFLKIPNTKFEYGILIPIKKNNDVMVPDFPNTKNYYNFIGFNYTKNKLKYFVLKTSGYMLWKMALKKLDNLLRTRYAARFNEPPRNVARFNGPPKSFDVVNEYLDIKSWQIQRRILNLRPETPVHPRHHQITIRTSDSIMNETPEIIRNKEVQLNRLIVHIVTTFYPFDLEDRN